MEYFEIAVLVGIAYIARMVWLIRQGQRILAERLDEITRAASPADS